MNMVRGHCYDTVLLMNVPTTVTLRVIQEEWRRICIAGVLLNGRDPAELKIPELKCWLQCRMVSVRWNRKGLIQR